MSQRMSQPAISVRTLETQAERDAFFHTIALAYNPDSSPDEQASAFIRRNNTLQRRSLLVRVIPRGIFFDSTCIGTYQIEESILCIGSARFLTGCIGYVGTHPDFQRQGIASALMRDAIAFAEQQQYALLLLVGIPNFYTRFGFTNIADYPRQVIKLADIATQPASPYHVRAATEQDSEALLTLYQTLYNRFERSVAIQADYLHDHSSHNPPWLVLDERDQPQGYLLLPEQLDSGRADEVGATDWPATLALLQHHAALLKGLSEPPTELHWPRPFDSGQAYETSDYIPVQWQIYCVPDGEWMACMSDVPRFIQLFEVEWRERWQRAGRAWSGRVTQIVGDYAFTIEVDGQGLRLLEHVEVGSPTLRLHPATFIKLVFGWRPVAWAMRQPGTEIPDELVAIVEALYPMDRIWFPPSDEF